MSKMNKDTFCNEICCLAKEQLGEKYDVKLQGVIKNNGVKLQGLIIVEKGSCVFPTIYLDPLFEEYQKGIPVYEILDIVLKIYQEQVPVEEPDLGFFHDFDKVKDRICYKLVNAEENKELLSQIPHVLFLDLAICFYYAYQGKQLGEGSILIYNSHMIKWRTSVEILEKLAAQNTERIYPWEISSMDAILEELFEKTPELKEEMCENKDLCFRQVSMKVLTNQKRIMGAICILYPHLLEKIAEDLGGDFFILPSSIHEVIVLPIHEAGDCEELKKIIQEVNRTQLEIQEILSDNLYCYYAEKQCVEIV